MEKIPRNTKKYDHWLDLARHYDLTIIPISRNINENTLSTIFKIVTRGGRTISLIEQKLYLNSLETVFPNKISQYLTELKFIIENNPSKKIKGKIFMTYFNYEESIVFLEAIGSPLLSYNKEIYLNDELILQEHELSLWEKYLFEENEF